VPPADRIPFQRPQPQDDRLMTFKLTDYQPYDFANRRHIGPSPSEMEDMLQVVGAPSLDALIDETVPASIRQTEPLTWGRALSEQETLWHLKDVASKNRVLTSLIGMGYYGTVTPPVIQRNILENPAWYTSYTPLPTRDQPGPARSAA
jgi:glycine dehydrogenase